MTTKLDQAQVNETDAPFSRLLALTEQPATTPDTGHYLGHLGKTWTIGKKVHGGSMVATSAAAGLRWLRAADPALADMAPIAASSDFLGAPDPGDVEYEVHIRKIGRQICLADVNLIQHGRTLVRTALTFGHLDDAAPRFAREHDDMPIEPPADAVGYEPGTPMGKVVHIGQAADLYIDREWARFLDGETAEPRLRLWIRPRAADQLDPEVAMFFAIMSTDISPPVTYNLGHFGWTPTVQMSTYLRRKPAPGWLRVITTTHEVGARLFDEDQLVVDSTGAVVAQSRQLALIPVS